MKFRKTTKATALILCVVLLFGMFPIISSAAASNKKVVEMWVRNPNLSWGMDERVIAIMACAKADILGLKYLSGLSSAMSKNVYLASIDAQNIFVISTDTKDSFSLNSMEILAAYNADSFTANGGNYSHNSHRCIPGYQNYYKEVNETTSSGKKAYCLIQGCKTSTSSEWCNLDSEGNSYYITYSGGTVAFEKNNTTSIGRTAVPLASTTAASSTGTETVSFNYPAFGTTATFANSHVINMQRTNDNVVGAGSYEGKFIISSGDENVAYISSGIEIHDYSDSICRVNTDSYLYSSDEDFVLLILNNDKFVICGMDFYTDGKGTTRSYYIRDLGYAEFVKIGEYIISENETFDPQKMNLNLGVIEVIPDSSNNTNYVNCYELGYGIGTYVSGTFTAKSYSYAGTTGTAVKNLEAAYRSNSSKRMVYAESYGSADNTKISIRYNPADFASYRVPSGQWLCSFETTEGYIIHFSFKVTTDPLSELKTQVDTNTTNITKLLTDLADLQSKVTANVTNILNNTNEITDIKTQLTDLKTQLTQNNSDLSGVKTDITNLQTQLTNIDKVAKTINLGQINICNDEDGKTVTLPYQFNFNLGNTTYTQTSATYGGVRCRFKTSTSKTAYDTLTLEIYIADASAVSAGTKKVAFTVASGNGYKVFATLNIVNPPDYTGTTTVVF